jgi:hypothetical protein
MLAVVAAAVAAGGAFGAFPDTNVDTYTGCLSSGGTIVGVAKGLSPAGSCASSQVIHLSGGDITKVSAGTGLTGGGDTGAVTLGVDSKYALPQGCAANKIPKWNGSVWQCADDANNSYTNGAGLDLSGNTFSIKSPYQLPQGCSDGQAPKAGSGSWSCGNFANSNQSCSSGKFANGVGSDGALACGTPPDSSSSSNAYFATNSHIIDAEGGTGFFQDLVATAGLSAGNYLVWATVENFNVTGDPGKLFCGFKTSTGQFLDPVGTNLVVPPKAHTIGSPFTIVGAASATAGEKLVITCSVEGDTGQFVGHEEAFATITALKVDSLN